MRMVMMLMMVMVMVMMMMMMMMDECGSDVIAENMDPSDFLVV